MEINNILKFINDKGISIKKLSEGLGMDYSATHKLVYRESLGATQLDTVIKVADYLSVDIKELYTQKGAFDTTITERAIMISEYLEKVYAEEIDYMTHYAKGYITVYENAQDFIDSLQDSTSQNYNFGGTINHFNQIIQAHYKGGADLIHSTDSILIAIDSTDGPTISFYEVTADDFWELWGQMTKDATKRYPGEDEDDDPHYPSIWIDKAIKNSIGSIAPLGKYKELNGYVKEI